MPRYSGSKGAIYMSSSGAGVASPLPGASKFSIDFSTETIEVTAFGDPNRVYVQSLKDVSGNLSAWFDSANDALFDAADSVDGVNLYLYPSTLAPTIYFAGPAWVDASIEVDVKGAIGLSGDFKANGAWVRKP